VVLEAPAKVNLFLRVRSRRPDGFHDLETLFQAIDLVDRVEITARPAGVSLDLVGPDLGPPEDNLAVRAARAVIHEADSKGGVRVRLEKHIPAGAGLGGGSSDAAAVLRGVNLILGSPIPQARLHELGTSLGSDVPFFLGASPLAFATGRGERLVPLAPLPSRSVVVLLPPVHVATGQAYDELDRVRQAQERPVGGEQGKADRWETWDAVATRAHNDFQGVVPQSYPQVGRALESLRQHVHGPVLLSGSGAACYGLPPNRATAHEAAARLRSTLGWPALVCRTLEVFPEAVVRR
jgi:4-diphosphocytidyl-2-C-methyl-D-erythritol kinase